MSDFLVAFLGGTLLGLSAVGFLYVHGRIVGISGFLAQLLQPQKVLNSPTVWFLAGLILTPFLFFSKFRSEIEINSSVSTLIFAGVLVGIGTRLGSGCTSGHGICGISRGSKRSIVATISFMLTGFLTVYIMRHVWGI